MKSYSLHDLDLNMIEIMEQKRNGFYIEAGCNDGRTQSNTLLLEEDYGWTGLLIDPNPKRIAECKANRPNSIVEHYALVSDMYDKTTIFGNFDCSDVYSSLMSVVFDSGDWTNNQLDEERIEKRQRFGSIEVPAITLTKLLENHNVKNVDLLSLDVEGYEISVLNGLDFNRFSPKYILIETTSFEDRTNAIHEYLLNNNYMFLKQLSINDRVYILK